MKQGWYLPRGGKKAHFFPSKQNTCLCKQWCRRPSSTRTFITDADVKEGKHFCKLCLQKRNRVLEGRYHNGA